MRRTSALCTRVLAIGAIVVSLGAVEARADHVFTLSGVTFADGGTATGTFTSNDALNALVTYDITTSGGGATFDFHYTPGTTISTPTSLPNILVLETSSLSHLIEITFLPPLTVAGAPIEKGDNISFEQDPTGAHRLVTAGSVVAAVPEPSSLLMAGAAALAGLGALVWRRQARRQA
jgi:hypothetical protein